MHGRTAGVFRFWTSLVLLVLSLSACGFTDWVYSDPDKAADPKKLPASIAGIQQRDSEEQWQSYRVAAINERKVEAGLLRSLLDGGSIEVPPGRHKVVVAGKFNRPFSQCPCEAYAEFEMEFEAGSNYVVVGKFIGERLRLWIANAETKKPVVKHADVKWRQAL